MMPGIPAYGKQSLLGRAGAQSTACGMNKVDVHQLARGKADIDIHAATDLDKGICAGITMSWIIAFLGDVTETFDTTKFRSYFGTVLRLQGTYLQFKTSVTTDGLAMAHIYNRTLKTNVKPYARGRTTLSSSLLPKKRLWSSRLWAGYLGVQWTVGPKDHGHAIGIGRRQNAFYIMDPNNGLHRYSTTAAHRTDLLELCRAICLEDSGSSKHRISYCFYSHDTKRAEKKLEKEFEKIRLLAAAAGKPLYRLD